jgi:glucosylceramidase
LREFIAEHLGPTLRDRKINVELWLGLNGDPPNNGNDPSDRLATVLEDPKASAFLTGIAFQYDSKNQIATARELAPDKKLMQSETECQNGANSWADAQRLYGHMLRYFEGGANAYFLWNMVLNETGMSTWKWSQNAAITINRASGKVTRNGEYYVMRHFSQFVKPGAKRVLTIGLWGDKIAFVNPDGSLVIIVGNSSKQPQPFIFNVAGRSDGTLKATLPAQSISTFVVPAQNSSQASLSSGAGVAVTAGRL